MDLKSLKSKLEKLNSSNQPKEKKEKKNVYWKPTVGKEKIRVVPSKYNPENPFTELDINYSLNKTILSPENFQEKDPIVEFANKLKKENDKEKWILSKKIANKTRIFLPVIVRGKEEEGVKLWQFGKQVYMDFLNLADNEDIGDFTDILEGRDITVTTAGPESTGTPYNKSTIMPDMKVSPLHKDAKLVEKWLDEQPNPIDQFTKYSYDEIMGFLTTWLTADDSEAETEEEEVEIKPTKSSGKIKDLFKEG